MDIPTVTLNTRTLPSVYQNEMTLFLLHNIISMVAKLSVKFVLHQS